LQAEILAERDKIAQLATGFTDPALAVHFDNALDALTALATLANTTPQARADVETAINAILTAIPSNPGGFNMKDNERYNALIERLTIIVKSNAQPESDSLANLFKEMVVNDMTQAASYTLHIGPNYSFGMGGKWANEMTVTYVSFNPGSLGLSTKNIKTQNNATEAIDQLDKIIKSVSGVRAKIGTYINRLEYTINNISSLEFNTQDAESRIRDTDFAQSTTEFTRNQILVQSATSMLAQANTLPQTALTLING
jgi:flagellin